MKRGLGSAFFLLVMSAVASGCDFEPIGENGTLTVYKNGLVSETQIGAPPVAITPGVYDRAGVALLRTAGPEFPRHVNANDVVPPLWDMVELYIYRKLEPAPANRPCSRFETLSVIMAQPLGPIRMKVLRDENYGREKTVYFGAENFDNPYSRNCIGTLCGLTVAGGLFRWKDPATPCFYEEVVMNVYPPGVNLRKKMKIDPHAPPASDVVARFQGGYLTGREREFHCKPYPPRSSN